jgi:DNA polymerase alpha-associated DNA helicase A
MSAASHDPAIGSIATEAQLSLFIDRHRILLAKERNAEVERSSLLLSNCGPKLLEQKGLALLGLGIVGVNIGLGGKTSASCIFQH